MALSSWNMPVPSGKKEPIDGITCSFSIFSKMAEGSFSQDKFSCPVCLDLLKDPVTIPCGHSYCMSCITDCWNREDQTGVYSCPQCRHTFTSRPALCKNVMLAELVEDLKKTKLQTIAPAFCYAGPLDVECDVCTGIKYKAVKSCLECLNSYCQTHLEQHEKLFQVKKHDLMDPTGQLNDMICPKHNKRLEIYCRTDQKCICYPCLMDEHKTHDTTTAVAERTEKQKLLEETQKKFKIIILESEKKIWGLKKGVESYKHSAQTAVKESERIFGEMIRFIEIRRSEVTQLIRDQEKAAVSQANRSLSQLDQEIVDLKRRIAELQKLSCTDNHIQFLQSFQSVSAALEPTDSHSITVSPLLSFDDVKKSVSQLKEKLEDFCSEEIEKISGKVTYITIIQNKPKTRREFLQYYRQFTMDSNTGNKCLRLFDGNRSATNTDTVQQNPEHPDRFDFRSQVLCKESVTGRCYWEVEWSGDDGVLLSVSYRTIKRKGNGKECTFGWNDHSWSLFCSPFRCLSLHSRNWTDHPVSSSSSRIGMYVDHSAGTLSFYSVSDTMTLIHRVQTTFTQPLYPGFTVNKGSSVKVCKLTE
ncbi:tripartite motif-containing protein 16-like [Triplophysa dalaica]|uniref:tripartite motif-containing protein 16-like n=1 Tax=Triplophysa dalaica TaxID=1582913 RepID=UPI0024E00DC9|nr:tripartite motif-containing protein 16-like [Triplophysa dalaica]